MTPNAPSDMTAVAEPRGASEPLRAALEVDAVTAAEVAVTAAVLTPDGVLEVSTKLAPHWLERPWPISLLAMDELALTACS